MRRTVWRQIKTMLLKDRALQIDDRSACYAATWFFTLLDAMVRVSSAGSTRF